MIDKNFFQVWIGDDIPQSALFSFNTFKEVNPDFNCEFISFSIDNPGEWIAKVPDIAKVIANPKTTRTEKGMCISIALRYYLIQTYGGIFCDADMFPIHEFDDKLLSLDRPFKMSKIRPDRIFLSDDCGFMGCEKGTTNWSKRYMLYPIKLYDYDDETYVSLKNQFLNNTLKYGQHYNDFRYCYVDHYDGNTLHKNVGKRDG